MKEFMKMNLFLNGQHTYVTFIKHFIADGCGFWDSAAEISEEDSAVKFDEFK